MGVRSDPLKKEIIEDFKAILQDIFPRQAHTLEEYRLAVEIQRNKILKEGFENLYTILDDIRYNREH